MKESKCSNMASVLGAVLLGALTACICQAQQPGNAVPGAQVLTRGPVHEAFAGIVTFNPEPGVAVTRIPPALIEEMPPEEKPEGDNVTWIPGYWAWDDERTDFLWVSGTWRALPPGRQWIAGYWGERTHGYQWTSGYWAGAKVQETIYLPPPPATVEVGPNIAAPSLDYGWTPGCWVWHQQRYAWRPGYWVQGRADWDWTPAHYVWTPRGYIFVGGFWDYPVARRGVLFAPVNFDSGYRDVTASSVGIVTWISSVSTSPIEFSFIAIGPR
jgi:WXXGXW repeat (2 copies)